MAAYQRKTACAPAEVLERADDVLPALLGLAKVKSSGHQATYEGAEGTLTISAHRHGPYTEVVAGTDRLRTSRIDYEVQRFLTSLPYEPGDAVRPLPLEAAHAPDALPAEGA